MSNTVELSEGNRRAKEYRILYVDDEVSNLRIFKTRFKRMYDIYIAENGFEAIEILKKNDIHLLITDQKMPEMTGTELLERTIEDYPDLIRIILTGFADIEAIVRAVNKCGIYKYITKPYVQEELIMTFDKALETLKLKKERNSLMGQLSEANEQLTISNAGLESMVKERTAELQEAHKRLTESIEHAKTVQQSLLPSFDEINNTLKEFFVLYRPLQIVSGDFYWYQHLEGEQKTVIVVFDCMGHGVPGSMNTMIVYGLLNQIVREYGLTNPSSILRRLHQGILEGFNFEATGTEETVDAGVIAIDHKVKKISFAGAKSDLLIEKNGAFEKVKGSRLQLGSTMNTENKYEVHEFLIDSLSTYYLYSDGFQDQMNADYSKKLGNKGFVGYLESINNVPFSDREKTLGKILDDWKGEGDQVDDITVFGFKL